VTEDAVSYRVQEEGTVVETLLDLADRGAVEATVVEQPFYAPGDYEKGEESVAAGWSSGDWFVQLEDLDVMETEFLTGDDALTLAADGIDAETVGYGDRVVFEQSDDYSCGGLEPDEEMRAAWADRYRWFDDGLERAVYAALAEGHAFRGAPFDLADGMEDVREAYMADFGERPEAVVDNVVYTG